VFQTLSHNFYAVDEFYILLNTDARYIFIASQQQAFRGCRTLDELFLSDICLTTRFTGDVRSHTMSPQLTPGVTQS